MLKGSVWPRRSSHLCPEVDVELYHEPARCPCNNEVVKEIKSCFMRCCWLRSTSREERGVRNTDCRSSHQRPRSGPLKWVQNYGQALAYIATMPVCTRRSDASGWLGVAAAGRRRKTEDMLDGRHTMLSGRDRDAIRGR